MDGYKSSPARWGWVFPHPLGAQCPPNEAERGQGRGRWAPGGGPPVLVVLALTGFPLSQMADCGGLPQISQVSPTCHHSPAGGRVLLCPLSTDTPPPTVCLSPASL